MGGEKGGRKTKGTRTVSIVTVRVPFSAPVWAHNTFCGEGEFNPGEISEGGLETIRKAWTAEQVGVQLGTEAAFEEGLTKTDWVNPFENSNGSSTGFDDIRTDSQGNIWIVEYKGGTGALADGQMGQPWVTDNINRLLDMSQSNPNYWMGQYWGNLLKEAAESGKLKGVAYSTPFENGVAGETVKIPNNNGTYTWSYTYP